MANNKVKIKGTNGRSTRPMSYDHVTTIDFSVVKPLGIWEMIPGDHIDLTPEVWLRTQNLACPTFGKMDCITRAFFVPHRLVMRNFLDFWAQQPVVYDSGSQVTISKSLWWNNKSFSSAFTRRFVQEGNFDRSYVEVDAMSTISPHALTFGIQMQDGSATNDYSDFEWHSGASHIHYRFNPIGKRVWDIIYSLGYRFAFYSESSGSQNNYNSGFAENNYEIDLKPLLSYLKIFQDWYCPSEFRYLFNVDSIASQSIVYASDIEAIYDMLTYAAFIWYNDDMFSMCEHAPYSKQNSVFQGPFSARFEQNTSPQGEIIHWDNNILRTYPDSILGAYSEDMTGLDLTNTNFMIRSVLHAANWLQKNNLLTHRATDLLKSIFHVEPSAARLDISEYIGSAAAPVKISDVVSTEASDNRLGELGGKGQSYRIDKLKYTAEEFGYFMVLIELRPQIQYGQGVNPICLRVNHEDYWQEDFDAVGFSPVPTECLIAGPQSYAHVNSDYAGSVFNKGAIENRIFGYLPKYWSYKISKGNLSGDFMIPKNDDIQSYHLFRNCQASTIDDYVHNSLKFRYPGLSFFDNEFDRIFMHPDRMTLRDHFQLIASFECYINGYCLALSESWQVNPDGEERQGSEHHIQSTL